MEAMQLPGSGTKHRVRRRGQHLCSPTNRSGYSMIILTLLISNNRSPTVRSMSALPFNRNSRYFTSEVILPALDAIDTSSARQRNLDPIPALYTNDPRAVSRWLEDNVSPTGGVLGFDVESVPGSLRRNARFNGPAVVQLATPTNCLVVHLLRKTGRRSKACIPIVEAVLEDPSIVKVGCGIDLDLIELRDIWPGVDGRSRLDLGGVGGGGNRQLGLRTLAARILGIDLPKSRRTATSDWSQVPLSEKQLAYCARDAWAAAAVVERLAELDDIRFSQGALVASLSNQTSIKDLSERLSERRRVRSLIKSLLEPHKSGSEANQTDLPEWKTETVKTLRAVLVETAMEKAPCFDLEGLGFDFSEDYNS